MKYGLRVLRETAGEVPAREFGPVLFKRVRDAMVGKGWSRPFVNKQAGFVKRAVRWAVENELVPADRWHALRAVPGLARGRSAAPEPPAVGPAPEADGRAVLPAVGRHVAGMIEVQLLTGCRPGEVCRMRPCDLDTSGPVWVYRPLQHKNAHRGQDRAVAVGPKAQAVLVALAPADPSDYYFSPRRAAAEHHAGRTAARATPRYPSHMRRNVAKRVGAPKRPPAECYTTQSYGEAVTRACVKARVPAWSPNQLRHTFATSVRKRFGLEAAQVLLGHARADVTQIYAEKNLTLAATVAAEIG